MLPLIAVPECLLLPRVLPLKFILLCTVIAHSFPTVLGYLFLFIDSVFKFIHSATDIFFVCVCISQMCWVTSNHPALNTPLQISLAHMWTWIVCAPIGGNELPAVHLFILLMEPVSQSFPKWYSLQHWTRLQIPVPLATVYIIFHFPYYFLF